MDSFPRGVIKSSLILDPDDVNRHRAWQLDAINHRLPAKDVRPGYFSSAKEYHLFKHQDTLFYENEDGVELPTLRKLQARFLTNRAAYCGHELYQDAKHVHWCPVCVIRMSLAYLEVVQMRWAVYGGPAEAIRENCHTYHDLKRAWHTARVELQQKFDQFEEESQRELKNVKYVRRFIRHHRYSATAAVMLMKTIYKYAAPVNLEGVSNPRKEPRKKVRFSTRAKTRLDGRDNATYWRKSSGYKPGRYVARPGHEWEDTSHMRDSKYSMLQCKVQMVMMEKGQDWEEVWEETVSASDFAPRWEGTVAEHKNGIAIAKFIKKSLARISREDGENHARILSDELEFANGILVFVERGSSGCLIRAYQVYDVETELDFESPNDVPVQPCQWVSMSDFYYLKGTARPTDPESQGVRVP